ncbi:pyridoxamine 5'-phosphate oxidase family protein [Antarcticirhabdus aurantiaca]|uniref:Pyridoxamine 5'-phosphate oxidase family protein n=1 Tax=Antarcticirhabdus aurantiaca TaxID=2606717 RepID=A0ACD4NN53_9HYPH|nr:pyridoxamine 5'-phosphate oxidase family protein [Antarcticirhabdus aurantiaca]WAJ28299.1 pyridoxamine 5'-phosphate oxidase family protein [Jeongeuplla avenae]
MPRSAQPTDGSTYPVTARSRARRLHKRVAYERDAVHAVLDAAPICHVGYVIDGQPYVTPTIHWREGERVYWHGSAASRFLRQVEGERVCLTVSLMDGYVLARSAFNHSVNYRSAMVFGRARLLEEPDAVAEALRRFTDGLFPGRWERLRPMTPQELKATSVLFLDIEEATAKTRDAPPGDGDEADHPVWAGVLPLETRFAPACPAPDLSAGLDLPEELVHLMSSGRLR